jgi:CDP-glucose 4,6-dehydratase
VASGRAGNVIGGGDWAENRIVPDYFRAIKANETLILRNPNATRPWQHVLEPLSGYLQLATKLWTEGKQYAGGWNFGPEDMQNYSVLNLIQKMEEVSKKGMYKVENTTQHLHEANLLKLDISKATNLLGWRPVLSFEETAKMTVEGYEADLRNSNPLENRIQQIQEYTQLAAAKKINWAL